MKTITINHNEYIINVNHISFVRRYYCDFSKKWITIIYIYDKEIKITNESEELSIELFNKMRETMEDA